MANFIRHYYDDRCFGDLYAGDGQWDMAFKKYSFLGPQEKIRPLNIEDRVKVEETLNAFCSSLHLAATVNIDAVKDLFTQGCLHILGFQEITFWEYNNGWHFQPMTESPVKIDIKDNVLKILPPMPPMLRGLLPMPDPWNEDALCVLLPPLRANQCGAVVMSTFEKEKAISRERGSLARKLIHHFVDAYTHAVSVEKNTMRLRVRDQHIAIINSIFDSLGSRILNVDQAIAMAARGLRNLGYKRVLFSLVDPEGKRIQAVLDDSSDSLIDITQMSDWPLAEPTADLQPYIIHTKQPKIIKDARREPLANKKIVRLARMKAEALVPILNQNGDAIGTIHVEREDEAVPTQEEVDDLLVFGRQLSIAIEQSKRVNMLQSTLDKIPEPVVIIDRLKRLLYANRPANDLFGTKAGWQDQPGAKPPNGGEMDKMLEYLDESLISGRRIVHHAEGIGKKPTYCGAVLSDVIQDWQNKTIGALLHIQDMNYLYHVFAAFRVIAESNDTDSAIRSMMEATQLLGHKWGRLYLVDEMDPDCLVSVRSFGFGDKTIQEEFTKGHIRLPRSDEPGYVSWKCIDLKTPLVFCWKEDLPNDTEVVTRQGLRATNVNPPRSPKPVQKQPGDFWIDFPLISQAKVLGKVVLQCDESLRPEEFELLKVLSDITTGLLGAFLRRGQTFHEREDWIRRAADETMAVTAHNIATRFSALPVLLDRYKKLQQKVPKLEELNRDFSHIMKETLDLVKRTKDRLSPVTPLLTKINISDRIRNALRSALPADAWDIKCEDPDLIVHADTHLLENAIQEFLQNSRDAIPDVTDMHVSVNIRSKDNWVKLVYSDNGPGVPGDFKERIFENFFSYRPGRKTGTGLGLGFVRRVIEAHGGTVREEGRPGQGVKFVIEIPKSGIINEKEEEFHVSNPNR